MQHVDLYAHEQPLHDYLTYDDSVDNTNHKDLDTIETVVMDTYETGGGRDGENSEDSEDSDELDDYVLKGCDQLQRSSFTDFQKGLVDVQYIFNGMVQIVIGVRMRTPKSIYEQVAVDIARTMRWGDVVEAQFAQEGPLDKFRQRVRLVSRSSAYFMDDISETMSQIKVLPPLCDLPWNYITDLQIGSEFNLWSNACDATFHCKKRRAECYEDLSDVVEDESLPLDCDKRVIKRAIFV